MSRGLNVHQGGPPLGPYRGFMGNRSGSRLSTSAAAYNTVGASTRNYLIHVYKSRDDLEPFPDVDEFNTLSDRIKTSIWSFFVDNAADRDLSVKDWAFHREKRIGLIFCTSEVRQKRVIGHIIDMGLGGHIVETQHDINGGMKMSFKMPVCFDSQQMTTLIKAIFVINDLTGDCGSRELRTDRPKNGSPYVVCTVHFPENAVEYAEQHDWRLEGPDGMLYLYGTDVSLCRKAIFERAKARKIADEEYHLSNPTPLPSNTPRSSSPRSRHLGNSAELWWPPSR
jgi:hypothetical protein